MIVGGEAVIFYGHARYTGDVDFDEAWPHRKKVKLEAEPSPIPINYLDLENLIKNKEASARPKDLDDLKYLKSSKKSD